MGIFKGRDETDYCPLDWLAMVQHLATSLGGWRPQFQPRIIWWLGLHPCHDRHANHDQRADDRGNRKRDEL
ncbi:MAG: hypothetical protein EBS83_12490 [Planctomycetia bacterium]|nr:hypothetical protein [Planctomycetia bacterium]